MTIFVRLKNALRALFRRDETAVAEKRLREELERLSALGDHLVADIGENPKRIRERRETT
ncbi:hypothetical protein [Microvirga flavescens]|uniref:hypothetical protein n=1 Tax=Microvirga flavescens TaxID=2249811 RepID=UPI000DD7DA44|nr:hypothetical protein [Microvirga flavescens]